MVWHVLCLSYYQVWSIWSVYWICLCLSFNLGRWRHLCFILYLFISVAYQMEIPTISKLSGPPIFNLSSPQSHPRIPTQPPAYSFRAEPNWLLPFVIDRPINSCILIAKTARVFCLFQRYIPRRADLDHVVDLWSVVSGKTRGKIRERDGTWFFILFIWMY